MDYVEKAKYFFLNTGTKFPREIIWAMGIIKYAAAKSNNQLGLLEDDKANAIMLVSLDLADGKLDDTIVVDVFQTGSGTGLNMCVNEVIAREVKERFNLTVHPNDDVNLGQSSNDVVPTAIRLATIRSIKDHLIPSLNRFTSSLDRFIDKYGDVVKPGRTHFRDALPITIMQEFGAFKDLIVEHHKKIEYHLDMIREVPIGGTAVGTGFNTHPKFSKLIIDEINNVTKCGIKHARYKGKKMKSMTDLVSISGVFRSIAIDILSLCQDIRIMFSGPYTGIDEIDMIVDIPGSSIMPGKKNPVTVEAIMQAICQIYGYDHAISMASMLGEFELCMGIPLLGYNIIEEIKLLGEVLVKMADMVIDKIKVRIERCMDLATKSSALITIISPIVGYEKASEISKLLTKGLPFKEALRLSGIDEKTIDKLMDIRKWTETGFPALE